MCKYSIACLNFFVCHAVALAGEELVQVMPCSGSHLSPEIHHTYIRTTISKMKIQRWICMQVPLKFDERLLAVGAAGLEENIQTDVCMYVCMQVC